MPPLGITVIDGAISDCEAIIEWLEAQSSWDRSTVMGADGRGGIVDEHRTSLSAVVQVLAFQNPAVIHAMNRSVWEHLDAYANHWKFGFYEIEPVSVQRYEPGQKYDVHTDAGPGTPRVCSALVYLNDVEAGGHTWFPHFDFSVVPQAGRLVIFPSNYLYAHAALPPESGLKYAAAYWARG